MRVGFIGLGNMGKSTAKNLIKAGHELCVYNKRYEEVKKVVELGAVYAKTPKEAALGSDIVVTMLPTDKDVEETVFGMQGILNGMTENSIHISMSIISNNMAQMLAAVHAEKNHQFVFARAVETHSIGQPSELQIILSGPEQVREKVMPVLESLDQELFTVEDQVEDANDIKVGMNLLLAFVV